MTYTLTVNAGDSIAAPNGVRYRPGSAFTLTDAQYGLLTAGAKALLSAGAGGTPATGSLGGTVSHQVTVAAGQSNVLLPDGVRHKAGDVVVLSDAEYGLIPHTALASLFSADTTTLT